MNPKKLGLPFLLLLMASQPALLRSEDLPAYDASDANAAAVSERNLLASDRFWPYQVALVRPWQPVGSAQALPGGSSGVLIRVEASGRARIDFGRDGLYEVPVAATDLVERANRVRQGELDKMAPNFVLAIGPRLVDSASDSLRPLSYETVTEQSGFLCVFADFDAKTFAELATALAPLRDRHGVMTILFPQREHPDAQVRERLRSLKWATPFVFDHLAEAYTRSLIDEKTPLPFLMLVSLEGRVLFQSRWNADLVPQLTSALDEAFGTSPTHRSAAIE